MTVHVWLKTSIFNLWKTPGFSILGGHPKCGLFNELINELISENVFAPVTLINILLK